MRRVIYLTILLLSTISCSQKSTKRFTISGFAQGTTYSIVYLDNKESVTKPDIEKILNSFDNSCSIYNKNSLLTKINSGETKIIDSNIRRCIELSGFLYRESNGLYDITVKPLIEAYGFAASKGIKNVNVDSLLQYVGFQKIKIDGDSISMPKGVEIDLNSIAQGYSVDLIGEYFDSMNIDNYLVEVGGEIFAKGKNNKGTNWMIGIDKPIDNNLSPGKNLQTIVELKSGEGLATSGVYRKFKIDSLGNRINHTVNPKTGLSSSSNLLSATVIAKSAALADGYATMFIAMGTEDAVAYLTSHPEIGAYLVYSVADNFLVYEQNIKTAE